MPSCGGCADSSCSMLPLSSSPLPLRLTGRSGACKPETSGERASSSSVISFELVRLETSDLGLCTKLGLLSMFDALDHALEPLWPGRKLLKRNDERDASDCKDDSLSLCSWMGAGGEP